MSTKENIDLTKSYITSALFCLMNKKPYEEIAISDITKKAGVGRATFYRHFKTKDDIVREYFVARTNDFLQDISLISDNPDDIYENIFTAFSHLKKEKDTFKCLLAAHMGSYYLDYVNDMLSKNWENTRYPSSPYLPYHIAGSLCNISLEWIRRDCKESVKAMADEYFAILFPVSPKTSN